MIGRICLVVVALCCVSVSAFTPMSTSKKNGIVNFQFQQARVVPSFYNRISPITIRSLSSTEPESETTSSDVTTTTSVSADGTFYDDEVEPAKKIGISETMKERLIREASTGLDADKPQNNVILYIIAAVSVLVLLGGKDIFY